MPHQRDGGKVPGVLCLTGDADHRAGAEATIWIMALQTPVAPAPAAVTDHTAAPWLTKHQLKPATCVLEESVGTTWGVGTEINLVNRLNAELPDKHVFFLDRVICPCSTMYRMHPAYMLWSLEHLAQYEVVNQITVDAETANEALVALDRMLAVR